MTAPPQPFFDLADCIEAAEKAAASARALALDNPEQAERHGARAVGYDRDAKRWRDELAPMNKDTVVAYAKIVADAKMSVEGLGMMNQPLDVTKRVERDAEYRIAKDKLQRAEDTYRRAFDQWASEGYLE